MAGTTRQLCFGIDPYTGEANLYEWIDVPDSNASAKSFTCGVVPAAKGAGINAMQETVFLGTTSAAAQTFQSFVDTVAMDGSQHIVGSAITHRIDPDCREDGPYGKSATAKRYESVQWCGKNPKENGAAVYFAKDSDPVNDPMVSWTELAGAADDSIATFESGLAQWVNLKIVDSTANIGTVILPPFAVNYTTVGTGRDIRET
jgi:hypothetical protein